MTVPLEAVESDVILFKNFNQYFLLDISLLRLFDSLYLFFFCAAFWILQYVPLGFEKLAVNCAAAYLQPCDEESNIFQLWF